MYTFSVNNCQYNDYNMPKAHKATLVKKADAPLNIPQPTFTSNPIINQIPFNGALAASNLRTEFISKEEISKYNEITNMLDKDAKKKLNYLLKTGALLNSDSNDNSTTLDNLYLLATTPRAQGLNNQVLLLETIETLADPHIITQQFGNIPKQYLQNATILANGKDPNVEHSGTCPAASIEFTLADKRPAEFARFAQGLSSPEMSVNKTMKLGNLADNTLDAVWLLNAFEIPYEANNFNEAKLKFSPDKNAIVRAHIQTVDRDKSERSSLDVLMQSTFMQVGSQQSYDTLTDKRAGKFNQNDKGLIEFEKTFTESVVDDKNKVSVTYQKVDENAKLVGYETDINTMKRQITDALNMGENIIIGYTLVDENNTIINGHEITITGYKIDKHGKMSLICNDTDDGVSKPIVYPEDYLLPKIHHATFPQEIVKNDMTITENWVEGIRSYKEMKKNGVNRTE